MTHRRSRCIMAALILTAFADVAHAQTPPCPAATTTVFTDGGTPLGSGAERTFPINLQPCQTVSFSVNTSTTSFYGATLQFEVFNSDGTSGRLYWTTWAIYGPHSQHVPVTPPWLDTLKGTRGLEGLPGRAVLRVTYGAPNVTYTITMTIQPRPNYNIGGVSFGTAPLISRAPYYGSLHQLEPGQYFKIRLNPQQSIYLSGELRGFDNYGAYYTAELFDSSGTSVKLLASGAAYGLVQLPTVNPAVFTNASATVNDYYLRWKCNYYPVDYFRFVVEGLPGPQLTLFLDADNNFETNGQDDAGGWVPGSDFASGLSLPVVPEGTAIQQVRVIGAFVDASAHIVEPPGGVTELTFALQETSSFVGYAMNAGSGTGPDYSLVSSTATFVGNLAIAGLNVFDYGGFTTIVASQGSYQAQMKGPLDANGNWIADGGWKATANGLVIATIADSGLAKQADEDDTPVVSGDPPLGLIGDGLTNFEEYRGFAVRGEHRRTNPFKKDVFISSNLTTGITFAYPNLPTTTHRVRGIDETGVPDYRSSDRVINENFTNSVGGYGGNIPGHYDQKALRVQSVPNAPQVGLFGYTFTSTSMPATPNETDHIEVYLDTHTSIPGYTQTQISNELGRTTGHEIGHGLFICHRSASCVAADSIMNSDVQGTPASDPHSQYNQFDSNHIRLHIRF